jgi:uncharacterized DUF497 family protein
MLPRRMERSAIRRIAARAARRAERHAYMMALDS